MNSILIQKPSAEDITGIQNVFYHSWLGVYPNKEVGITEEDIKEHFKDAFTEETLQKRKDTCLSLSDNACMYIAKDGNVVVGVSFGVIMENCNKLRSLYLLPEYQGKGIGKMLWDEMRKFFNPDMDTIVHVVTYNTQAISFYEKLGFVDTGKRFTEERHRMPVSHVLFPEMEMILKHI